MLTRVDDALTHVDTKARCWGRYSPDLWVHDLIAIHKLPERIDSSNSLLAIRPIGILCAINAAHDYDAHLAEEMPSIQEAEQHMTTESEYMISSDASDGYDLCVNEKNSRKYVRLGYWSTAQHKYRILQCVRMPQGLKSAGV